MKRKRILCVEYEPDFAALLRHYFRALGYQVRSESTAIDGLSAAHESSPDLVILDLDLPDMDGLEFCRNLRRSSAVPILVLTARVGLEPAIRAQYEAQGCGCMKKPVPLAILVDKVVHVMLGDALVPRGRSTFIRKTVDEAPPRR